jgi:hypothetical protein
LENDVRKISEMQSDKKRKREEEEESDGDSGGEDVQSLKPQELIGYDSDSHEASDMDDFLGNIESKLFEDTDVGDNITPPKLAAMLQHISLDQAREKCKSLKRSKNVPAIKCPKVNPEIYAKMSRRTFWNGPEGVSSAQTLMLKAGLALANSMAALMKEKVKNAPAITGLLDAAALLGLASRKMSLHRRKNGQGDKGWTPSAKAGSPPAQKTGRAARISGLREATGAVMPEHASTVRRSGRTGTRARRAEANCIRRSSIGESE